MTPGQLRALSELRRIELASPGDLEVGEARLTESGLAVIEFSIRIGPVDHREGGIELLEREAFHMGIPQDFPFDRPFLYVTHRRFEGCPHVTWTKFPCLYRSEIEWNPADGMFGFVERLSLWLTRAAANDMDPAEWALEPPHHSTDFSQTRFLFSADAPAAAGAVWIGWAHLQPHENRTDVIGWSRARPSDHAAALTVLLPQRLPMEFPKKGEDFLNILAAQGVDRTLLLELLQYAAAHGEPNDPLYLILGSPARRSGEGHPMHHFAVWSSDCKDSVRLTQAESGDSIELENARAKLADAVLRVFDHSNLRWCPVDDERDEISVPRDRGRPMAWFRGKRILILGCGALGSWIAENVARARAAHIVLVDKKVVSPGVLARQNYSRSDIGSPKAEALARRLRSLGRFTVDAVNQDAHGFLSGQAGALADYDLIIDCTASAPFHMKLERDWTEIGQHVRRMISLMIDARAEQVIAVHLGSRAVQGPWACYLRLKETITLSRRFGITERAFYDPAAAGELFQPEPGCSDPTFAGSAVDLQVLSGAILNRVDLSHDCPRGFVLDARPSVSRSTFAAVDLPRQRVITAGSYRVSIPELLVEKARLFAQEIRVRESARHETGGLIWGHWDDAAKCILLSDISGPPPDSIHSRAHFKCGLLGTQEEHDQRMRSSREVCGFVGMWHTHPGMPSVQSGEDVLGMSSLVARVGQNQRRALMLIFGVGDAGAELGIYVYESVRAAEGEESLSVGAACVALGQDSW